MQPCLLLSIFDLHLRENAGTHCDQSASWLLLLLSVERSRAHMEHQHDEPLKPTRRHSADGCVFTLNKCMVVSSSFFKTILAMEDMILALADPLSQGSSNHMLYAGR